MVVHIKLFAPDLHDGIIKILKDVWHIPHMAKIYFFKYF
jgi:hypothetical protein